MIVVRTYVSSDVIIEARQMVKVCEKRLGNGAGVVRMAYKSIYTCALYETIPMRIETKEGKQGTRKARKAHVNFLICETYTRNQMQLKHLRIRNYDRAFYSCMFLCGTTIHRLIVIQSELTIHDRNSITPISQNKRASLTNFDRPNIPCHGIHNDLLLKPWYLIAEGIYNAVFYEL